MTMPGASPGTGSHHAAVHTERACSQVHTAVSPQPSTPTALLRGCCSAGKPDARPLRPLGLQAQLRASREGLGGLLLKATQGHSGQFSPPRTDPGLCVSRANTQDAPRMEHPP